mmetsp:Transcript_85919/g.257380  ORF Transcript_85919/g.257380 Transcript_85919/m.257380 type:complete len:427 (-) Transcript_85919:593-1873(-)
MRGGRLLRQHLDDRTQHAAGHLELELRLGDLLQQQLVELRAQVAKEHGDARRRAKLDPLVDRDQVLRMAHLDLTAEEEERVGRHHRRVAQEDLGGAHLLVVDEPAALEARHVRVRRRRVQRDTRAARPLEAWRAPLGLVGAHDVRVEAGAQHGAQARQRVGVHVVVRAADGPVAHQRLDGRVPSQGLLLLLLLLLWRWRAVGLGGRLITMRSLAAPLAALAATLAAALPASLPAHTNSRAVGRLDSTILRWIGSAHVAPHAAGAVRGVVGQRERRLDEADLEQQLHKLLDHLLEVGEGVEREEIDRAVLARRAAAARRAAHHRLIDVLAARAQPVAAAGTVALEAVALAQLHPPQPRRLAQLHVRMAQLVARGDGRARPYLDRAAVVRQHAVGRAAVVEEGGGGVDARADDRLQLVRDPKVVHAEA